MPSLRSMDYVSDQNYTTSFLIDEINKVNLQLSNGRKSIRFVPEVSLKNVAHLPLLHIPRFSVIYF